jgi:hypothetical protein
MAQPDQLAYARRGHADAVFVVLDFLGYANNHFYSPASYGCLFDAKGIRSENVFELRVLVGLFSVKAALCGEMTYAPPWW